MRRCEDIESQFLFCYRDGSRDSGDRFQHVESGDVNEWLRDAASKRVTAKDFRTWWGSVIALASVAPKLDGANNRKSREAAVREAVEETAAALGNTAAVCRNSYIHPALFDAGLRVGCALGRARPRRHGRRRDARESRYISR